MAEGIREGSAPNFCPPVEEGQVFVFQDEKGELLNLEFLGLILDGDTRFGFFFPVDDDNPALFVSERKPHKRLTTSAVRRALHNLEPEAGVDNIIPHRFRHTTATNAINSGMPVESVQAILGHSEIGTTMRYAHVSNDKVKADHQRYMR